MFQWLEEAFNNLLNFFQTLWDFLISLIRDIVFVIELLATAISNMTSYFVWLPTAVMTLLLTAISIIVIYKILGRD